RALPGVGELREESPALLECRLPGPGVAAFTRDPAEVRARRRLHEDLSRRLRHPCRFREEFVGRDQIALEEGKGPGPEASGGASALLDRTRGKRLGEPAPPLRRAAPGLPVAADVCRDPEC